MARRLRKDADPSPDEGPTSGDEAPKAEQRDVRDWHDRIRAADKVYLEWSRRFRCSLIEQFYENVQWPESLLKGDPRKEPYTVNLVHSTVESRVPTLYFFKPHITARPRPGRGDEALSAVTERAQLQEDTINTFIGDERVGYLDETVLAVRDIFARFGVVECGYSASFIENPTAPKPILKDDGSPELDADGTPKMMPRAEKILDPANPDELFYVRHIEASRFRVSLHAPANIERADWCGYYEWHYISDLKRDKTLSRTHRLKPQGKLDESIQGYDVDAERERYGLDANLPSRRGMVKIWKIWDLRTRTRFIVPDQQRFYLLKPTRYTVFPIVPLCIVPRRHGFYPYPIATTWISPQAEYNDGLEAKRVHRRRFHRRFQAVENTVTDEELAKLESGTDGALIFTKDDRGIKPIEDAPLDPATDRATASTLFDFQQVSMTGANQRNVTTGSTATEANIVDQRAQIGETYQRMKVAQWHGKIGRTLLRLIRAHANAEFWVKRNVDALQPAAVEETTRVLDLWQQVKAEELGDIMLDLDVDMDELSPINDATERRDWTQVLTLLGGASGPQLFMLLGASDAVLKKTLNTFGVRTAKDVMDVRNAIRVVLATQGVLAVMDQVKQIPGVQQPGTGTETGSSARAAASKPPMEQGGAVTPGNGQIQAQLQNQLPQ